MFKNCGFTVPNFSLIRYPEPDLYFILTPKSMTFNSELAFFDANKRFSGLRSLCTMPFSWQYTIAPRIWRMYPAAYISEKALIS